MKTISAALLFVLLPFVTQGCGKTHGFVSMNADINGDGVVDDLDQINTAGLVPCGQNSWNSADGTRPTAFYFPTSCKRNFTEPPKPARNLDIMFALDVTGSMGNELDVVRGGIRKLIDMIAAEKWNLRAGAVAFADAILEEHPASENLTQLLAAMDKSQPNWKATPGFGGDTPEIGLAAIERGLELLKEADAAGAVEEKILVYVSDAPAKLLSTHGFDLAHTSGELKKFHNGLSEMDLLPSFRFFYSSTASRKGLIDAMPTPLFQLEKLVKLSGVTGIKLPFPLATENLEQAFLVPLRQGAFRTEICPLENVKYVHVESGGEMSFSAESESGAHMSVYPAGWKSGAYKVYTTRRCSLTGAREEEISLVLP
jgi:hypothetical protein